MNSEKQEKLRKLKEKGIPPKEQSEQKKLLKDTEENNEHLYYGLEL